ncbi:MAG: MFS transporter [Bryobacteraceae bacterium]
MSLPQTALEKPTHARYWVIVFAIALAIFSYIDRVCMSQAAPLVSRDLHLSKVEMGSIFSAFGLAYALFEIPSGWLGDYIGPRKVLIRIVLWWSSFTALTGAAWSFTSLWIIEFLFGAGEAGGFPNLTRAFTTWLPQEERVRTQGFMWTFARWGGAFTPPLVVLAFHHMSWRWAFVCFGSIGLVWVTLFGWWFRDDPRQHKGVNAGELALLKDVHKLVGRHGKAPWKALVSSRTIWLLWAQYFCSSFPWYFYISWLPTYLQENRHLTQDQSARYAILPLLFGGFGSLFCGLISSRVARWSGSIALSRKILSCTGFSLAFVFILLTTVLKDPTWAMLSLGMASFSNDLNMPGAWGSCMDIGGQYAGTVSGSMNMMGNLAGAIAPAIGGIIVQRTGNWNLFLYLMAAMYLIGTFCWPFIDPVTPLECETAASPLP